MAYLSAQANGGANGVHAGHDRTGKFTHGNNWRIERRNRINTNLWQLQREYLADTPVLKRILRLVAGHMDVAERGGSQIRRERASALIVQLLSQIPKRPRQRRRRQPYQGDNLYPIGARHG
jgi:hypothetical protein